MGSRPSARCGLWLRRVFRCSNLWLSDSTSRRRVVQIKPPLLNNESLIIATSSSSRSFGSLYGERCSIFHVDALVLGSWCGGECWLAVTWSRLALNETAIIHCKNTCASPSTMGSKCHVKKADVQNAYSLLPVIFKSFEFSLVEPNITNWPLRALQSIQHTTFSVLGLSYRIMEISATANEAPCWHDDLLLYCFFLCYFHLLISRRTCLYQYRCVHIRTRSQRAPCAMFPADPDLTVPSGVI